VKTITSKMFICCAALLALAVLAGPVAARGEWLWTIDPNLDTGALTFVGTAGSHTPLLLTGSVFNNDGESPLSFDGIELKTDDMTPDKLSVFTSLWTRDSSVEMPGSFNVPARGKQTIVLGRFNLKDAVPGQYSFRLVGAGSYDTVAAKPDQITSAFVTVVVVPEPASLLALAGALVSLRMRGRARRMV